jgi:hypothetical protein
MRPTAVPMRATIMKATKIQTERKGDLAPATIIPGHVDASDDSPFEENNIPIPASSMRYGFLHLMKTHKNKLQKW